MNAIERIIAKGHPNIRASNKNTFEITRDPYISRRGDCIVAVAANRGLVDLGDQFRSTLCKRDARLTVIVEVNDAVEIIEAFGGPELTLEDSSDLVVRRSSYTCERTLAIRAKKAARDFSRSLVARLRDSQHVIEITLVAEAPGLPLSKSVRQRTRSAP